MRSSPLHIAVCFKRFASITGSSAAQKVEGFCSLLWQVPMLHNKLKGCAGLFVRFQCCTIRKLKGSVGNVYTNSRLQWSTIS